LTNYISALGYADEAELYQKFWEKADEVVHVIGKDIVRFHVAIWPAMLLAAGIRIPDKAMIHGFITSDGQKMSKSLGNVVDPVEVAKRYGTDPLRYYILKEIPVGKDGDFTFERFDELYNSDLANNLGNLVNRVLSMIQRYEVDLVEGLENELHVEIKRRLDAYHEHWQRFEIHLACEDLRDLLVQANQYVDQKKPWELAKSDKTALTAVLYTLYQVLVTASVMITPIMPETALKIQQKLGLSELKSFQEAAELLPSGKLEAGEALFPRLES
jgi:methionyl-tRNA synthetase